jgi:hypothetical protein
MRFTKCASSTSEPHIEAAERIREALVIDAQDVEHRGVKVAEDRIFGDVVAEIVGAADTYRAE